MTKPIDQSPHDPVWDDSRITAYILEELPAEQRQSFEQEIASDPALAAAVEEARQIVGDVSALYASEAKPTLSDAHRETLRHATSTDAAIVGSAEQAASGRNGSDHRYRFSGRHMLVAASVLFLLGLGSGLLLPALSENSRRSALSLNTPDDGSFDEAASRPMAEPSDPVGGAIEESGVADTRSDQQATVENSPLIDSSDSMASVDRKTAEPPKGQSEFKQRSSLAATPFEQEEPSGAPAPTMPPGDRSGMAGDVGGYGEPMAAPDAGGYGYGMDETNKPPSRRSRAEGYGMEMGYGGAYGSEMGSGYGAGSYGNGMGDYGGERGAYPSEKESYGTGRIIAGGAVGGSAPDEAETVTAGNERQRPVVGDFAVNAPSDRQQFGNDRLGRDLSIPIDAITGSPADATLTDQGRGPGMAGDQFQPITDNPFRRIDEHPLSTFSIDVDTASYAKVRSYLLQRGTLPRPDAVRIEELINYFNYDYDPPAAPEAGEEPSDEPAPPFASHVEFAACPWKPEHRLARIGIKGKEIAKDDRPAGNYVFLIDVSGSMNQPNKLPLVKQGMQLLLGQLNEQDRIAIVVYAGAAGLVLDSTPGDRLADVRDALERLRSGGSTNGGEGIQLAYNVARDHFIEGGVNRVILCTDGDFNVGTTGTDSLVRIVEEEAKAGVFLSILGFGMGNHNDTMLEQISGRGNGNYAFIDTIDEAHKVLVEQVGGTLVTIAKDVKIQVEFNPAEIAAYRLIGYENRILAKEDFNDDTKDAGEIGAGHTVTALYELVPAGKAAEPMAPEVDPLRYQIPARESEVAQSGEWLTVKLRYKEPDGDTSRLVEFPAKDDGVDFAAASRDFQFAASVASFGMLLRNSPYKGDWTLGAVEESAAAAIGDEPTPRRSEFLQMVKKAAELSGR